MPRDGAWVCRDGAPVDGGEERGRSECGTHGYISTRRVRRIYVEGQIRFGEERSDQTQQGSEQQETIHET